MVIFPAKATAIEYLTPPPRSLIEAYSSFPPTVVDLSDASLVHYWSTRFGASEAQLRQAIREVGRDLQLVQLYLSRDSWPSIRKTGQ